VRLFDACNAVFTLEACDRPLEADCSSDAKNTSNGVSIIPIVFCGLYFLS